MTRLARQSKADGNATVCIFRGVSILANRLVSSLAPPNSTITREMKIVDGPRWDNKDAINSAMPPAGRVEWIPVSSAQLLQRGRRLRIRSISSLQDDAPMRGVELACAFPLFRW